MTIFPITQTPLIIPGLSFWYDAADPRTITQSSGAVSVWADKSSRRINPTQGTESFKPSTNTNTLGGNNVITFGGNDFLVSSDAAVADMNGSNFTLFVICRRTTSNASNQRVFSINGPSGERIRINYNIGSNLIGGIVSTTGGIASASVTLADTASFGIITFYREGKTVGIRSDSGSFTTGTNASITSISDINSISLGRSSFNSNFLIGDIAEFIGYNKKLTIAEMNSIYSYLSNKWGIAT